MAFSEFMNFTIIEQNKFKGIFFRFMFEIVKALKIDKTYLKSSQINYLKKLFKGKGKRKKYFDYYST